MKLTINTDVLSRHSISLGEFLILLMGYHNIDYESAYNSLIESKLVEPDLFTKSAVVLSDNTKNLVARIIVESDSKVQNSGIADFEELAELLQQLYPEGVKPGKTYSWRSDKETIAQKLMTLVAKYDFKFTVTEAVNAVNEYVSSFQAPYTYMHTLKNFILYTKKENGKLEMESLFMTIIENNR